jgi:ferredoxin
MHHDHGSSRTKDDNAAVATTTKEHPKFLVLVIFTLHMGFFQRVAGWPQHVPISRPSFSLRTTTASRNQSLLCRHLTSSCQQVDDEPKGNAKEWKDPKDRAVHQVRWKTAEGDIVFDALDGETVRTAALRRGLVSPHNGRANLINCRGLGTCGTCAVQIEGAVQPAERNVKEQLRLSFPPHGSSLTSSTLRLACQVQVRGDIEVTKRTGFWGQYDDLAEGSVPSQPFGELEFLLDDKSPADALTDDDHDAPPKS